MRAFFQKNCSAKLKRVVDHVIGKLEKKGFSVSSVSPNSSNPDGFVKVVTTAKGRILGASIVGAEAGELIQVWALANAQKLDIKALADWVVPYPTRGEVNKRAAMRYYAGAPANPFIRKAIDWLGRLG